MPALSPGGVPVGVGGAPRDQAILPRERRVGVCGRVGGRAAQATRGDDRAFSDRGWRVRFDPLRARCAHRCGRLPAQR